MEYRCQPAKASQVLVLQRDYIEAEMWHASQSWSYKHVLRENGRVLRQLPSPVRHQMEMNASFLIRHSIR